MRNTGHPAGSWYAATADLPETRPALKSEVQADVCVVGAGFTGLGAALELARRGAKVVVVEEATVGSGGTGRNGGQVHPGQRREQDWLERVVGAEDARRLWTLAEEARANLHSLIGEIDCDWRPGLIQARHRLVGAEHEAAYADLLAERYDYPLLEVVDRERMTHLLGTDRYFGGLIDHGGGHLHPLKLALGMARLAEAAGATIHERSRVTGLEPGRVRTAHGSVECERMILTGDGYLDGLVPALETRVMPINNFIAVTEPLDDPTILPSDMAAADSRFVIRYWRKTPDGRLLFGGGETYTPRFPADIAGFVRRHMLGTYPQLASAAITHAWGGTLGVTTTRLPYVGGPMPGVLAAAGYSGQGVMLAPYFGRLLAQAALGEAALLEPLKRLPTPAFPGGKWLRWPALAAGMSWYALRDRL
ncbi:gamma-glutamylputrescine oxidase [Caulobacter ginsengisoli]|uniref:Gamma-glutamylputrescine oxidase n=1 Tax=Caulobacter ginsengisoli TaxID=400775 RepID=A0ABU0ISE9_9CAUL|nr:FAD-binding oxidoreductase [Caulobacter ginsengisoli]MDQ0464281.1 gamma-glutamylputrescine oxidase [Caulobacter ginsengisoli]